jgi:pimeloyl-ACP methyl ester carboxylesterase
MLPASAPPAPRSDRAFDASDTAWERAPTPTLTVNDVELHHEVRGDGPPVLLVMGATGVGAHFAQIARLLADEFTVVTYDRRGNGRSPPPAGWSETSTEEQADDAAALLAALGLSPAAVFGTSTGAVFTLCMLVRHPEAVRGAILHEPGLFELFDDPDGTRQVVKDLVAKGMQEGKLPGAMEQFWRFVAGDASWEGLEPGLRGQMLDSAGTYFGMERGRFDAYVPPDDVLAAIAAPVAVMAGERTRPVFVQASRRLAERLGVEVMRVPGAHAAYLDHAPELAEAMRPFLREVGHRPA